MSDINRSIDGVAKTIAEVVEKKKCSIDYYQREYKWESKQTAKLVTDLTAKFLELYEPDHARKKVSKYPGYSLGSIIVSHKGSQPFVVDGQQRLTSLANGAKVKYEVEHIWVDYPERHTNEFSDEADFARHLNRIGDLRLLPKQFNASHNDDPYEEKLPYYYGQNLLAASLNSLGYEKNPGFITFIKKSVPPFSPYESFSSADVVERGNLYCGIAKQVWNPDNLLTVAGGAA
ncbi:hypothetical protein D092_22585 [Rhodococcus ruber Chol-4]|uniref:DUF262 domain-containing protein n=1 Tax=Rhodococcus ruber TaxID=1830 RepID=UPI0003491634|nr:DUF262 domain-containing protein [Rhodococcus ruber]KXF84109.1 hypothetical protein D092_22585 [Rhodococcus ruber Chol-4]